MRKNGISRWCSIFSRRSDPALAALALGFVGAALPAQAPKPNSKDHEVFRKLFAEISDSARRSTARVVVGTRARAYAVVVSSEGFLLSKASEVGRSGELFCEFANGDRLRAVRGPVDEEADLMLLDVRAALPETRRLRSVSFDPRPVEVGDFLACVGCDRVPFAIGVVSLEPYVRATRGRAMAALDLPFAATRRHARIAGLSSTSPTAAAAKRAGIREGDIVESVSGRAVSSPRSFARAIRRKRVGQRVRLELSRGDETLFVEMKVERSKNRSGPRDPQQGLWGELSRVRIGFPKILQHDAVLRPRDCASVLVDLQGRVVGLNIARVGRVETHALPSSVVVERMRSLLARVAR